MDPLLKNKYSAFETNLRIPGAQNSASSVNIGDRSQYFPVGTAARLPCLIRFPRLRPPNFLSGKLSSLLRTSCELRRNTGPRTPTTRCLARVPIPSWFLVSQFTKFGVYSFPFILISVCTRVQRVKALHASRQGQIAASPSPPFPKMLSTLLSRAFRSGGYYSPPLLLPPRMLSGWNGIPSQPGRQRAWPLWPYPHRNPSSLQYGISFREPQSICPLCDVDGRLRNG